mgnify:CR=1 FL=1
MFSTMMDEWDGFKAIFRNNPMLGIAIGICLLGGVMRGIRCPRENFTRWGFLQRVLAAGFIGSISWLLGSHFGISETLNAAVTGAAGYTGIDILQCLTPWVKKRLRIDKIENGGK